MRDLGHGITRIFGNGSFTRSALVGCRSPGVRYLVARKGQIRSNIHRSYLASSCTDFVGLHNPVTGICLHRYHFSGCISFGEIHPQKLSQERLLQVRAKLNLAIAGL